MRGCPRDGWEDDEVERALADGTLSNLQAPLRPGDYGVIARWIGGTGAAVLTVYDAEAEPGAEYDGVLWSFRRSIDSGWEVDGGPGTDFPTIPGDRPPSSRDVFPIEGFNLTTGAGQAVVTYGVAAEEVRAVEIHDRGGVRRVEVGVFGGVAPGGYQREPPAV